MAYRATPEIIKMLRDIGVVTCRSCGETKPFAASYQRFAFVALQPRQNVAPLPGRTIRIAHAAVSKAVTAFVPNHLAVALVGKPTGTSHHVILTFAVPALEVVTYKLISIELFEGHHLLSEVIAFVVDVAAHGVDRRDSDKFVEHRKVSDVSGVAGCGCE